jgi:hypothetical protein
MMSVIVPTWIAAGLLDYIWHRRTKIETTSGPRESLLHLFMLAEGAPVVLAPLVRDVNAGILALMIAAYLAHQATAMWDINTTVRERLIPANEQHIHAYLEGVPFAIVALYSTIHWQQFLALLGLGSEKPRFEVRLKQPVLPLRDVVLLSAAVGVLAQQGGDVGTETPGLRACPFRLDCPPGVRRTRPPGRAVHPPTPPFVKQQSGVRSLGEIALPGAPEALDTQLEIPQEILLRLEAFEHPPLQQPLRSR